MGGALCVCIPAFGHSAHGSAENHEPVVCSSIDSPSVAQEVVVHTDSRSPGGFSHCPSASAGPLVPKQGSFIVPGPTVPRSDGLETERRSIIADGISDKAAETILLSIRSGTRQAYNRKWVAFSNWCQERLQNPFAAPLGLIIEYLQYLFDSGLQYNTICVHRSVYSRYHNGISGINVGDHPLVSQFVKGVFNLRPPNRVLVPSWDLTLMLEVLKEPPFYPLASIDL